MGASLHREPSMNPGRARPYQTATSYLTVHAPALTSCVLLEGCCSRSASAAVSMAHVTFARVSAVCGRRAGGTALGGRSSDCAVSCCIATLMRSWKAVSKPLDTRSSRRQQLLAPPSLHGERSLGMTKLLGCWRLWRTPWGGSVSPPCVPHSRSNWVDHPARHSVLPTVCALRLCPARSAVCVRTPPSTPNQ